MVPILQLIAQSETFSLVLVSFFDIGHLCYGHLTPVKTVSAEEYHVTILWGCCKQEQIVEKSGVMQTQDFSFFIWL